MSNVCVSVERIFGDIVRYFSFADSKKNPKVSVDQIGKIYAIVFRN